MERFIRPPRAPWGPLDSSLDLGSGLRDISAFFLKACSWQPLTMLNPQFVAGEHGLFGGHKSEDIRTFSFIFGGSQFITYIQ